MASVVHEAKLRLGLGVPLIGRLAIPGRGSHVVSRDTLAVVAHDTQIVLSRGVALIAGLSEPRDRLREILGGIPRPVRYMSPRFDWALALP